MDRYIKPDPKLKEIIKGDYGRFFIVNVQDMINISKLEQQWKFSKTTWKVMLACIIPFGTFYIDHKILRKLPTK